VKRSPWGKVDNEVKFARGLIWVETASHGGFLVGLGFADRFLTGAARARGKQWGSYLAYEEDCDCLIVLYELPETRR